MRPRSVPSASSLTCIPASRIHCAVTSAARRYSGERKRRTSRPGSDEMGASAEIIVSARAPNASASIAVMDPMPMNPFPALPRRPRRLRDEDRRAGGAAAFQIPMCLGGVLERIFLVHGDLHSAGTDDLEQIARRHQQILALGGIVIERRPRRKQRAFLLQDVDVERFDLAGGAADAHEVAKRPQAIERSRERGLADTVIDDVAELAAGDLLHLRDEILIAIENGVMRAILLGEFGLFLGTDGTDDGRAEVVCPLACDQAYAARGSVNEADGALANLEGAVDEILHRHALEHHAGGLF